MIKREGSNLVIEATSAAHRGLVTSIYILNPEDWRALAQIATERVKEMDSPLPVMPAIPEPSAEAKAVAESTSAHLLWAAEHFVEEAASLNSLMQAAAGGTGTARFGLAEAKVAALRKTAEHLRKAGALLDGAKALLAAESPDTALPLVRGLQVACVKRWHYEHGKWVLEAIAWLAGDYVVTGTVIQSVDLVNFP